MADINFPDAPVAGSTYDFQGVRYTYKDTGGGTGLWQVLTPGPVGIATTAEIDAGTEALKYITPAELNTSKYITPAVATTTEVQAGLDNTKIVTPLGLSSTLNRGCYLRHSSVQAIPTGSVNTILLFSLTPSGDFYDSEGLLTVNSKLTVPVGATWARISVGGLWQASSSADNLLGTRTLQVRKNSSGIPVYSGANIQTRPGATSGATGGIFDQFLGTAWIPVVAGDYFFCYAGQTTLANTSTIGAWVAFEVK